MTKFMLISKSRVMVLMPSKDCILRLAVVSVMIFISISRTFKLSVAYRRLLGCRTWAGLICAYIMAVLSVTIVSGRLIRTYGPVGSSRNLLTISVVKVSSCVALELLRLCRGSIV